MAKKITSDDQIVVFGDINIRRVIERWLAQVGYERVKEIEDPELASQRARAIYKAKGYSDAWIEKRMHGIQIRDELTDEWKNRGVTESEDFGILTAESSL